MNTRLTRCCFSLEIQPSEWSPSTVSLNIIIIVSLSLRSSFSFPEYIYERKIQTRFFLSVISIKLSRFDLLHHRTFLTFFLLLFVCMLLKMGGVSSTITQATRARLLMNYSFTIRYMYVYVRHPVCCRLLKYSAHKIKEGRRWRKRNDFVMSDDNFSSCHFNSIKLLNVLVVIVKWSDNRFSFFLLCLKTQRVG